jgi:hypothetical protein
MAKCTADGKKISRIKAAAGSRILIDVPKELAKSGWLVAAFTSDGSGKNTPVSDGGSLPVKDKHTVRLQVPPAKEGGYFLQVLPAPGSTERSTWVIQVQLTA